MKTRILLVLILVVCLASAWAGVPEDRGAMGLAQVLNRLDVIASVLHTGAHPDDESSALLAWLSRGQGVRTAYLAITRGDGGQNLLGSELFEALGVIRTEELLAARRFDHAEQFFTPNMDFGFSKSADESIAKWGRQNVLGDFVRVMRAYRPEIVVSAFSGTPADGHGHHQVAGIMTQEAFRAAADPAQFPQFGKPWQVKKLYITARGAAAGGGAGGRGAGARGAGSAAPAVGGAAVRGQAAPAAETSILTINTGEFDAALGRSYAEIAAEGRSLHRSQGQGQIQNKGPATVRIQLVQRAPGVPESADLFAGTLRKLPDVGQLEPSLTADLNQLEARIESIRQKASVVRPGPIFPEIVEALKLFQQIRAKATNEHVRFLLDRKEPDFHEAARLAGGIVVDVIANDGTVVPGQDVTLTASVINGGSFELQDVEVSVAVAKDALQVQSNKGTILPGQKRDIAMQAKVPANADFTQPYWLSQPRTGDRFVWPEGAASSMPFDRPVFESTVSFGYNGVRIRATQAAEYRRNDSVYGEQRSLVNVVPALSVRMTPDIAVVPLAGDRKKQFTVTVENQNTAAIEADVRLLTPSGWAVTPPSQPVKFARQGEKVSVQFAVVIPATAGDFTVQAVAKSGSQEFKAGYETVAYPHIETHYLYAPSASKVEVFDVRSRVSSIGYVEGAGDRVPDALRQLGVGVTMLSSEELATGDLSKFPVIVLGVRAYAVRDDLRSANPRLLEFVRNGGTLVVQYNRRSEVGMNQYGPYPYTINDNDRVTNEEAPVKILDAAHPVFSVPNKIDSRDFDGWVQERGTYFLSQWDANYTPLLESADPGEMPQRGGLLVAKYGKGTYAYTGYAFFRELPAGVKGAYRLFANLIGL